MPTIVIQPDAAAGKDSYVDSGNAGTNYGTNTALLIGSSFADPGYIYRSLIQFDLSSYEGVGVNSATLSLRCYAQSGSPSVYIRRVTAAWGESTVTWNDQPAHDSVTIDTRVVNVAGWWDWNVLSLVQAWVAGTPNNGMKLLGPEGSDSYALFRSSDFTTAGDRPKLTIVYTARPTVTATSPVGTQSVPAIVADTTTPVLTGTYTSADLLAMTHKQHLIYDELGALVWDSGKVAHAAARGDTVTAIVPAGYLRYGKKYTWRWKAWDANGGYSAFTADAWFICHRTLPPSPTDLAGGTHLYAQTASGRIVALEEGNDLLGVATPWRATYVLPLRDPMDWVVSTQILTRIRLKVELPTGSTMSIQYGFDGVTWLTAHNLTPAAGIQVVDIRVPFGEAEAREAHEIHLRLSGTGAHKSFALVFEYEEAVR